MANKRPKVGGVNGVADIDEDVDGILCKGAEFRGDVILSSAAAALTVGNGAGSPDIHIDKSPGGAGELRFREGTDNRWLWKHDTDDGLKLGRYDSATPPVWQDWAMSIGHTDGNVTFANNTVVGGQVYSTAAADTVSGTSVTCDFDSGNTCSFDGQPATGDISVTLENMQSGGRYYVAYQCGSTARTLSFSSAGDTIKWPRGTQPGAIGFNNRYDVYRFHKVGTVVFADLEWQGELTPG